MARKNTEPHIHSKREFLNAVTQRSGLSHNDVTRVYQAMRDEFVDIIRRGDMLLIRGFGRFYAHKHKGHPVQFVKKDSASTWVDDYYVLKFSASRSLNSFLDMLHKKN